MLDLGDRFRIAARKNVALQLRAVISRFDARDGLKPAQPVASAVAISSALGPSGVTGSGSSSRDFRNASHAAMTR